jgi:hypothetical protein
VRWYKRKENLHHVCLLSSSIKTSFVCSVHNCVLELKLSQINVQTWDVSIIETVMKNLYDRDLDTMVEGLHTNLTVSILHKKVTYTLFSFQVSLRYAVNCRMDGLTT